MDYELDYKIRTKKYDPTYKIKTYNEAMEFLKKAEYINSSHFDSMDIDEQMPNLSMPWHLKLEHWIDINSGEYNWSGAASTSFWINPSKKQIIICYTQLFSSPTEYAKEFKASVDNALINQKITSKK